MRATQVTEIVDAPRAAVYRALLDADAVQQWMVPDDMTSEVHVFEPYEGGTFRISLTYNAPDRLGKSVESTDTYHGVFAELVADRRVVQRIEFETDDPSMRGEMTITYTLDDHGDGTRVVNVHEHLPPGVSTDDNTVGTAMALAKLAALVESAR